MRRIIIVFTLIILILLTTRRSTAQQEAYTPEVIIDSPRPGEALQGKASITGSTVVAGLASSELSFGYANDTTETWFLIAENFTPVEDDILAVWDTFKLTDGNYVLRLQVTLEDGSQQSAFVGGLRVRNYSIIETNTPTVIPIATSIHVPKSTQAPTTLPGNANTDQPPTITFVSNTPTPLPPNPVHLSTTHITDSLVQGAAGTFVAFLLLGLYTSIRKTRRK